jgi:phosphatidate cytidylyltransferase
MLLQRVITAVVLLAVLLPTLYLDNFIAFAVISTAFFVAAIWESFRLFGSKHPALMAGLWGAVFAGIIFVSGLPSLNGIFGASVALWAIRFAPSLGMGLPAMTSGANRYLSVTYALSIFGCFVAIVSLFETSPEYLLSVMSLVWVADIGAYFAGKGFGRHKLAPSISPGKSWEGAVGGWLAVIVFAAVAVMIPDFGETFPIKLYLKFGPLGFVAVVTLLVIASVIGDLFESQLKRRAGMKDSSGLLPGHGGVLDRIDALIPVLPLAALIDLWL